MLRLDERGFSGFCVLPVVASILKNLCMASAFDGIKFSPAAAPISWLSFGFWNKLETVRFSCRCG